MSDDYPPIPSVQEMVSAMETAWASLQAVIDAADAEDLVRKTDAAGWSAKDHLVNLNAWANSVLVMIRDGRPQREGLGIDEQLFAEDDYDRKNEAIRQRSIDASLEDVRAGFASTHDEFVSLLRGMTDQDLHRPVNEYVPGAGEFEIAHKIMGNTYLHYDEHREYIERILAS